LAYDITLEHLIAGFGLNSVREGEQVQVQASGFASSEDGTKLVSWLEELVSPLLSRACPAVSPSQVDHLVAVIRKDRTARIYVNEVPMVALVRPKKDIQAGQVVLRDDVADVGAVRLQGVELPADAGVVVLISSGWRKGLFFDLAPLHGASRTFNLDSLLGNIWTYLSFEDRFRLTEDQWTAIFSQGWFPFVGFNADEVRKLAAHVGAGWNADELTPAFAEGLRGRCQRFSAIAEKLPAFAGHLGVLNAGIKHFLGGDHLSASGLLYPRIEGILRHQAQVVSTSAKYSQKALAEAATADTANTRTPGSLLLPAKFQRFLETVYFANFDPKSPADVSRNTVSHGVAPEEKMNLKAAVVALLVIEQLLYLCGK